MESLENIQGPASSHRHCWLWHSLCRSRTTLPWYAILFQSKCQAHWLIRCVWEHGSGSSSSTRLLHYFFNEELLTLLHKQAELWPETLSLIFCKCKWRESNSKWRAAEGPAGLFIIRHIHGNNLRHGFTLTAEGWQDWVCSNWKGG